MSENRRSLYFSMLMILLAAFVVCIAAHGQPPQSPLPADPQLKVSAALVLTPELCATKTKKGKWGINQENFPIGDAVCKQLWPALNKIFFSLALISDVSKAGDAQLVLTPVLGDVGVTQKATAFQSRELVVQLEWTVKDKSGKTIWVETVQGSAKHHMGNAFTYKKNLNLIVDDSVKDAVDQSVSKMAASAELQKYAASLSR
jgi:hypothetical protein